MTDQPQPQQTPQERLNAATDAFHQVSKMLPQGAPPFQLPPFLEPTATLNALVELLIAKGIIDGDEFLERKLSHMADMTEQSVAVAQGLKRQMMGLVVAEHL